MSSLDKEYDPEANQSCTEGAASTSEREGLLVGHRPQPSPPSHGSKDTYRRTIDSAHIKADVRPDAHFTLNHLMCSFASGVTLCFIVQLLLSRVNCPHAGLSDVWVDSDPADILAPSYVGSTEVNNFPPMSPTNYFPDLFPT